MMSRRKELPALSKTSGTPLTGHRPDVSAALARRLATASLALTLAACTTLGDDFIPENAAKVRNGMTREEVIAIMGSPPSHVEGRDRGHLLWLHSTANPISYGALTHKVLFTMDESGRVYGIPKGGLNP